MKFPKSLHAEGWSSHLDTTTPEGQPPSTKPSVKPAATTRPIVHDEPLRAAPPMTSTAHATSAKASAGFSAPPVTASRGHTMPPRSGVNPWLIGAGVGLVLIGLAVAVSRNLSPSEPTIPATTVVGQASPSPEDAQLRAEPPSAGPATPAPETPAPVAEPPAVTAPAPAAEPPRAVAAAPAEPKAQAPAVIRAAPTSPASRSTPPTETVAQASPRRESALVPIAPVVTPAPATPAPVVTPTPAPATPPAAVPPETVPPVAQAQPQPPAVNPEDAGITQNVRVALASDATLAGVPIVVSTDHGVVKLEGQAPDAQSRERATVVAAGTSGVKAVDNRLTLPPVATVGQAPSGNL